LSKEGFDITTAVGGAVGIELLRRQPFQAIVSDLRMPDVSGLEILAEAKRSTPRTPFVMFTAWGTDAGRVAAKALGASEYIDGLWDIDTLVDVVRRAIEGSAADPHERMGPATERWVELVVAITRSERDIPTLSQLCRELGRSLTTIKRSCDICDVHAGDSLDFGRALRVIRLHAGKRCRWYDVLEIKETGTMTHFLERAGFSKNAAVPSVDNFLPAQRFISESHLLQAIRDDVQIMSTDVFGRTRSPRR
jgi:DNA-binding NarL/FixJ family response regulator